MGKRGKKKKRQSRPAAGTTLAPHRVVSDDTAPLSLCMIVKNEARFLPDCLASVRGLVREIIIMDTGSTDNTIDIARQFGARVYSIPWENDFAKARNAALRKATQPWILYLDADERLYPEYHSAVKQALASDDADAYYVKILSHLNGKLGNVPHTQNYPRIFKNLPGVQFEGKIHEQITPSLSRLGARFKNLDITIEHLGYNLPPEDIEAKIKRNLKFLEEQVAAEPDNWYALFQLGQTYIVDDQIDKGLTILHRLLQFDNITVTIAASALALIGNQLFLRKEYLSAREYIHKSIEIAPNQRLGYFLLSEIEAALENWDAAIRALEKYLENEELAFSDLGVDKVLDHKLVVFRLARNWIQLGRYENAAEVFQVHLLQRGYFDTEILEKFLQILAHIPETPIVEQYIQTLFGQIPNDVNSELYYRLIATFCQEKGLLSLETQVLSLAVQHFPQSALFWYALGNARAKSNEFTEAIQAYEKAITLSPTLYEAYYNAAVLAMKNGNFPVAMNWFERIAQQFPQYREEANRRIAALLIKSGQLEAALQRLGVPAAKTQEVLKMHGNVPNM